MSEKMPCWFHESEENRSHLTNDVALCFVNSITLFLNVIASGTVVYRYYQTRTRQPVSNTLLVLLAALDLLKSSVGQTLHISIYILKFFGIFHCTQQGVTETILCITLGFSFAMATIILTSERFFAVVFPIYHRIYMRKKVLVYVCLTLFAIWVVLLTIFHVILAMAQLYLIYVVILSFGLVYTLAVYIKIFRVIRKSTHSLRDKKAHSRNPSLQNNANVNKNNQGPETNPNTTPCSNVINCAVETFHFTAKEKKTIVRMLFIIGVLYLTTIPLLANFAYAVVNGIDYFFIHYFYPWATSAFFTSGAINAYVYCYRNEHFCKRKPSSRSVAVWSSTDANTRNDFEQGRSQKNSIVE